MTHTTHRTCPRCLSVMLATQDCTCDSPTHTTKPDWADGGAEMWVGPTRAENAQVQATDDPLVHLLWEHYPEALPPWPQTPEHIRKGLVVMASKIREYQRHG